MARPKKSPNVVDCLLRSGEWFAYTVLFGAIPVWFIVLCYLVQKDSTGQLARIWSEGLVISLALALVSSVAIDYHIYNKNIISSSFSKNLETQQQAHPIILVISKIFKTILMLCFWVIMIGTSFFFVASACKMTGFNETAITNIHIMLLITATFFTFSVKVLLYLTEK